MLEEVQHKAEQLLDRHYVPPQRYGTAFHLTPPFSDVRAIPSLLGRSFPAAESSHLSAEVISHLEETINDQDPYLLSQIGYISTLASHVLIVQPGQEMTLQLPTSSLAWMFLGEGAQLTIEQVIAGEELALPRLFIWQQAASHFTYWGVRANNNFLSERMEIRLVGQGATARVRHLTFGSGRQQSDLEVVAYHEAPQTQSDLIVRTAAAEKHTAIYRGLIDIAENAKGSKGYQSGRALLLSRTAAVDNLPELAIKTNDVQCSHGVTTTHIDDESLFYMRSRGISYEQARELAVQGFYHDKLDIPSDLAHSLAKVFV
jgi:hypothetical protein